MTKTEAKLAKVANLKTGDTISVRVRQGQKPFTGLHLCTVIGASFEANTLVPVQFPNGDKYSIYFRDIQF